MTDAAKPSLQRPLFYALLLLLLFLTYLVLRPFLAALAWAVIFAVLLHGVQTKMSTRFGPSGAALLHDIPGCGRDRRASVVSDLDAGE